MRSLYGAVVFCTALLVAVTFAVKTAHAFRFEIDGVKTASLHHQFHSLEFKPPCENGESDEVFQPHCVPNLNKWVYKEIPCEYFGFQYSMEWFFAHVFETNTQFVNPDGDDGSFIFFPHCISRVYFVFKIDFEMEHWAAIHKGEREYLIPLLKWAHLHPLHKKYGGKNFFTVFSMDLGRQDFNLSVPWLEEWSVGQLAGDDTWIQKHYLTGGENVEFGKTGKDSCYKEDTYPVVEANEIFPRRVQKHYDTVISIPTRFQKTSGSVK